MSLADDPGLVYACVTHVPLWVAMPPGVQVIHLGAAQGEGRLNLRELAPEWEHHHRLLGGTAGSLALLHLVRQRYPQASHVGLCQYRKFVSARQISRQGARGYPGMWTVTKAAVSPEKLAEWTSRGKRDWVACCPQRLPSVLRQYEAAHHAEDLLRFTAQAVQLGVLGSRESHAFVGEELFVPGGIELGVFPAPFWLGAMAQIEAVLRGCVDHHPIAREGYQLRAWSFCAERLGSWLLLREWRAGRRVPRGRLGRWIEQRALRRLTGFLNLVVEDAGSGYRIGS